MMNIKSVGVIGSGQMGAGIAHVIALHGYDVLMHDVSPDRLKSGLDLVHKNLARQVSRSIIDQPAMDKAMGHIKAAKGGLIFDDSALLLSAAAQGLGAALARSGLVEGDLREGRLVRPFDGEAPAEAGYHFVWREDSRKLKRILRLRDWLIAESAELETQL